MSPKSSVVSTNKRSASAASLPAPVASKRRPANTLFSVPDDDVHLSVPVDDDLPSTSDDVDDGVDFAASIEHLSDAVASPAVVHVDPLDPTGVNIALTFRAILEFSFGVLLQWSDSVPAPGYEVLKTSSARDLAELAISGMPQALVEYLDSCLADGIAWDVCHVMTLLHPISARMYRQGLYLIQLTKASMYGMYGGSSEDIHQRLQQHFKPSNRKKEATKVLYRIWDSLLNPTLDLAADPVLFLPIGHVSTYGVEKLLALEAVVSIYLCGWNSAGRWPFSRSSLFPASFITSWSKYARLNSTDSKKPMTVLYRSLSKAAGKSVPGTNFSFPLIDSRVSDGISLVSGSVLDLMGGSPFKLHFHKGSLQSSHHRGLRIYITIDDTKLMSEKGFTVEMPFVEFAVSKAPYPTTDCYAVVDEVPGTTANPLGYEDAPRILLKATWECKNHTKDSIYVHMATRNMHDLQRACLAMTIYEYADGTLGPNQSTIGRRRHNLFQDEPENETKAWDPTAPEMADTECFWCPYCPCYYWSESKLLNHLLYTEVCRRQYEEDANAGADAPAFRGQLAKVPDTATDFYCPYCLAVCPNKSALHAHIRDIELCRQLYEDDDQKGADAPIFSKPAETALLHCPYCPKFYSKKSSLRGHIQEDALCRQLYEDDDQKGADAPTFDEPAGMGFQCPYCSKYYPKKRSLQQHIRRTTECKQLCDADESKKAGAPKPKKSAQTAQTFPCKYCSKVYTRNENLQKHIQMTIKCKKLYDADKAKE